MANWQRERGRESGIWNSELRSIRGRLLLPFKAKRHELDSINHDAKVCWSGRAFCMHFASVSGSEAEIGLVWWNELYQILQCCLESTSVP